MNKNAGLSIIIPYYNSREKIERCLDSVISNSIDIEVVLIDDCSSENCDDIIEKYVNKNRLCIKYLKNRCNIGAGESRNRGIKKATKKYITFLDSDDELSPKFFETIQRFLKEDYDEIIFDAKRVFEHSNSTMKMFFSNKIKKGEINRRDALVYIKGCTCGKIYRTKMIQNNNIKFGDIPINEDMIFTKIATSYAYRIYYIDIPLYLYNNNIKSLMNSNSILSYENEISAYKVVEQELRGRGLEAELNSIYFIEVLYAMTNTLLSLGKPLDEIKEKYKVQKNIYQKNDIYRRKYNKIYLLADIFFDLGLFAFYWKIRILLKKIKRGNL